MNSVRMVVILRTWIGLNAALPRLKEAELEALLATERRTKRRPTVLIRIHNRFNRVRGEREREELRKLARRT